MRKLHTLLKFESGRGCGLKILLFTKELEMIMNKTKH